MTITYDQFAQVEIRSGTIVKAEAFHVQISLLLRFG